MATAGAQAQAAPIPLIVHPGNANDRVQLDDQPAQNSSNLLYYQRFAYDICKAIERGEYLCWTNYRFFLMVCTSLGI